MYNSIMIYCAKEISRNQQRKLKAKVRGIYSDEYADMFDIYLKRYPNCVITLETALAIHGLIDNWVEAPFDMAFQIGYRIIKDVNVKQYRDKKEFLSLGVIKQKHNNISYHIYDKERLLIELWRKEKYLQKDIYKQAIFSYRKLASSGQLNIPLIRQYLAKLPKFNIYTKRLSMEVI